MTAAKPSPPDVPPPVVLLGLIDGFFVPRAIHIVAELGVADYLADGAKSAEDLARAVGAHPSALHRLLRALASVGVFTEVEPRCFALTPVGEFLRTDIPGSLRPLARMIGEHHWNVWGALMHSVTTGQPAYPRVHGLGFFDYVQRHPDKGRIFDEAMTGYVSQSSVAVAAACDFTRFKSIVDVGGGHGALMAAMLKASPLAGGTIFDLPGVVPGARERMEAAGLSDRCQCVGGDFFAAVPAGGDAYTLASILHDWDDERCAVILRNCRRVMTGHEMLLLVEMVIPPGDAPFFGKLLDLEMLVSFGGRERTEAEYGELLGRAGFRLARVTPTATPASVIEAIPI